VIWKSKKGNKTRDKIGSSEARQLNFKVDANMKDYYPLSAAEVSRLITMTFALPWDETWLESTYRWFHIHPISFSSLHFVSHFGFQFDSHIASDGAGAW
jgi:hypothetical protein